MIKSVFNIPKDIALKSDDENSNANNLEKLTTDSCLSNDEDPVLLV